MIPNFEAPLDWLFLGVLFHWRTTFEFYHVLVNALQFIIGKTISKTVIGMVDHWTNLESLLILVAFCVIRKMEVSKNVFESFLPGKYMFVEYSWNIPTIHSRNIRKKFPMKFRGMFPGECSGNIEYRNIPWMSHEYPTNVTCIFLVGSRNTIVVFSSG